jgi:hypothetical protein
MKWAVAAGLALAACGGEEIDPEFRKEMEIVCEAPTFGFGNLRLRTAQGRRWQEKLNDAPMGQRPMVAMREAKRVGLKQCGALPPELLDLPELPAIDREHDVVLDHHDARKPPLLRGADTTWGDVVAATPAGQDLRFAAAYGLGLRTLAVGRGEPPPPDEEDRRMTVAVTRQQLAVWSPSGVWRVEDPPVLVLRARADGTFDSDALGRMFEALIAVIDVQDEIGWKPSIDIRFFAADDVTLRAIAPVLPHLRRREAHAPGDVVLRTDAPAVAPLTDRVRLVDGGVYSFARTEAEHLAWGEKVRAHFEREHLASVAACRASWPEAATAGGALRIKLAVTPTGELHAERSVRGFGFEALDTCVLRSLTGWRFPPAPDITYKATFLVGFGV